MARCSPHQHLESLGLRARKWQVSTSEGEKREERGLGLLRKKGTSPSKGARKLTRLDKFPVQDIGRVRMGTPVNNGPEEGTKDLLRTGGLLL